MRELLKARFMKASPKTVFSITLTFSAIVAFVLAQASPPNPEYQIRIVTTMAPRLPSAIGNVPTVGRLYFGRADGSYGVRTTEIISGRSCTTTTYTDFDALEQVVASDCVAMKNTTPLMGLVRHLGPVPTCSEKVSDSPLIGTEMIGGLKLERYHIDSASEDGTLYLAPALGCLAVRQLHNWKTATGEIESMRGCPLG